MHDSHFGELRDIKAAMNILVPSITRFGCSVILDEIHHCTLNSCFINCLPKVTSHSKLLHESAV